MAPPTLAAAIDAYGAVDRHWGRNDMTVQTISPIVGPAMTLRRYAPSWKDVVRFETNGLGQRKWMMPGMHRVYVVVMAELKAGRELHTGRVAAAAHVSRSYASKCIGRLAQFRFIVIAERIRGRLGRIVASVLRKNVSTSTATRSDIYGGNIPRLAPKPRHDYRWKLAELKQFEHDMEVAGW